MQTWVNHRLVTVKQFAKQLNKKVNLFVKQVAEVNLVTYTYVSNLKKLAKSGKIGNFVTKNKGCWDHQAWLMFCGEIVEAGYEPIDFDQVGLMLEKEKADFLHQF